MAAESFISKYKKKFFSEKKKEIVSGQVFFFWWGAEGAWGWKVQRVFSVFTIHNPKKYPQTLMFSLAIFTIGKVITFIHLEFGMAKA